MAFPPLSTLTLVSLHRFDFLFLRLYSELLFPQQLVIRLDDLSSRFFIFPLRTVIGMYGTVIGMYGTVIGMYGTGDWYVRYG
jgi:hypothetical protein